MHWDTICSPGAAASLSFPSPPGLLSRLSHRSSFNCNPRMGRAEKSTTEHTKTDTWTDGQLATGGRCFLPGQSCRVLASPRGREGPTAPGTGVRVVRAAVKLPARLEEEVMRQEEGLLRASPPLRLLLRGPAAGTEAEEGRLGWGCHPTRFQQECRSKEGREREGRKKKNNKKPHFTSWAQNNNKIAGMFAKEGAGLGKGLGGGEKVSVSSRKERVSAGYEHLESMGSIRSGVQNEFMVQIQGSDITVWVLEGFGGA